MNIKDLSQEKLAEWFMAHGQPDVRRKQLHDWLYAKHAVSFDEMANIPKPLREQLDADFLPIGVRHLFPIRVKNIYSGCVEGADRIITRHTGTYSLDSTERPQVFIFDADGTERQPKPEEARFSLVNGQVVVRVTVPDQGAAVIRKAPSVLETLEREIGD